jgi:hypothetical protein
MADNAMGKAASNATPNKANVLILTFAKTAIGKPLRKDRPRDRYAVMAPADLIPGVPVASTLPDCIVIRK